MTTISLVVIISIFIILCTSCTNPLGQISLPDEYISLDGTMFVTKNLSILPNNLREDANYSLIIQGTTSEISEEDWHKWFGTEEWDVNGRLAVVLRLEYDHILLSDPNANINIKGLDNTDLDKTYLISDLPSYLIDDQYIYLVLNIKHNLLVLSISSQSKSKTYTTKYLINMIDVNFEK